MGPRKDQGSWQDFSSWPPAEVREEMLVLEHRTLQISDRNGRHRAAPEASRSSCNGNAESSQGSILKYDPKDPTPSIGGSCFNLLMPWIAGEKDQCSLQDRSDVVIFDSCALSSPMSIVGRARLRLTIRASRPHFDVFAMLCDVHPSGGCYNVCSAEIRHTPPLESSQSHEEVQSLGLSDMHGKELKAHPVQVELTFWSTAKCFDAGHKIRLMVAGASFPKQARNFGDREQAVENKPLEVEPYTLEIVHSSTVSSLLWLPVLPDDGIRSRRKSFAETVAEGQQSPARRNTHQPGQQSPARRHSRVLDGNLRKIQSDGRF
jgi:putative CocE/NonD family hydrolase